MIIKLLDEDNEVVGELDTKDIVGLVVSDNDIKLLVSEIGILLNDVADMDLECAE